MALIQMVDQYKGSLDPYMNIFRIISLSIYRIWIHTSIYIIESI